MIQCIRYHLTEKSIALALLKLIGSYCLGHMVNKQKFIKASNCFDVLLSALNELDTELVIGVVNLLIALVDDDLDGVKKLIMAQGGSAGVNISFGSVWNQVHSATTDPEVKSKLEQLLSIVIQQIPPIGVKLKKDDLINFLQRTLELGNILGLSKYRSDFWKCNPSDVAYIVCFTIGLLCKNEATKTQITGKVPYCYSIILNLVEAHEHSNSRVKEIGNEVSDVLAGTLPCSALANLCI